ncbi:response regulator [Paenibacillus nanensis]|uniref:Response regulator n=1 Tax=Paenibacillus nanensis TaxID=393251 RepID=A0A3A1US44_9BACL|nr:response regulator [Paenibacillus nanensis]RIX50002.1 response regulator [Paenibacillus nanensis]
MKKVMLVDDEILIRETVKECIPWEKEGFQFVGDAPDGEIALQLIEQLQPDILITDIMMPFMDGLELSAVVRKRMPDIKIVILSGHGEFEYARSALRLGVEDYCLKPVSAATLIELLRGVSRIIDEERLEKEKLRNQLRHESGKDTVTREKLLSDLCCGFLTTSEAIHLSSAISLQLMSPYYAVVISDARDPACHMYGDDEIRGMADSTAAKTAVELVPLTGDLLSFKRSRTETVWILKGDSPGQIEERLRPFRELREQADSPGCLNPAIGIGSVHDRLQGIHLSYLDAEEDMHWHRLTRQNRQEMRSTAQMPLDPTAFLDRSKFKDFLKLGTPAEAESFVKAYVSGMGRNDWAVSPLGYYLLNDLTIEVLQSANETFRNVGSLEEVLERFQADIGSVRTHEDACKYLICLIEQYWRWRAEGADKYGELIAKVKDYIADNYDKDYISLQSASEYVRLSPSHLSKVFSQETGRTFIEYLTQTRIQKAMELLLTTHAKSYEVAFKVGYNDAHYFSNLFKRVTGMTTKQFRKNGGLALELKGDGYEAACNHG